MLQQQYDHSLILLPPSLFSPPHHCLTWCPDTHLGVKLTWEAPWGMVDQMYNYIIQGNFSGYFYNCTLRQKLNLELILTLNLLTNTFSEVKMKLFQLNSSLVDYFSAGYTKIKKKWLEINYFMSQLILEVSGTEHTEAKPRHSPP